MSLRWAFDAVMNFGFLSLPAAPNYPALNQPFANTR